MKDAMMDVFVLLVVLLFSPMIGLFAISLLLVSMPIWLLVGIYQCYKWF